MPVVKKKVAKAKRKAPAKKRTRVAGRGKGTPNKDSKKFSLLEYARAEGGTSPVEFLLDILNERKMIPTEDGKGRKPTHAERKEAAVYAAPYCHPKLRSQEIKGEIIPATFIIKNS